MKKYKPMIIGCGNQGAGANQQPDERKIINFADAFSRHPGFDKICFVDQKNRKAYDAMRKFGGWATTIRYACEFLGAEIAIVTTPDDDHYMALKQLAKYPLKLVICEKPLCTDLEQAREIVQLYRDKGIPLMCDYTRCFIPELRELKNKNPQYGVCLFNRGWLHSGSHGVGFFKMLGIDKYKLTEVKEDYRVWDLAVMFEDGTHWTEHRIKDEPVPEYYDNHMKYVVENAYNFLEGKEPIKCTGEDGLAVLEKCFELMEERK